MSGGDRTGWVGLTRAYLTGVSDGWSGRFAFGLTYDGSPWSARSRAYDAGLSLGEWLASCPLIR